MATQEEYDDILHYKTTDSGKKYRDGLSDNQKRNIRDKAQRYVVEKQCLYVVEQDRAMGTEKETSCGEAGRERQNIGNVSQWNGWDAFRKGQNVHKGTCI